MMPAITDFACRSGTAHEVGDRQQRGPGAVDGISFAALVIIVIAVTFFPLDNSGKETEHDANKV
jgi:hypothetical protein